MEMSKHTKRKSKKILSIFLASLMIISFVLPLFTLSVSAETDEEKRNRIEEIGEIINAIPYNDYFALHSEIYFKQYGKMPYGNAAITITAGNIDVGQSKLPDGLITYDNYENKNGKSFLSPDDGSIAFTFTVPSGGEGLYHLNVVYYPVEGKSSSIERMVKIDDKVPFREARYLTFTKPYVDNYEYDESGTPSFKRDIRDNEIRPTKSEAPEWREMLAEDSSGLTQDPFLFYLTEGEHTLQFETVKEPVIINELKFYYAGEAPTYEEYKQTHASTKKGTAEIKIQAEMPVSTSEITIYPLNDRTSSITEPQDPSRIRLNSIGGDKWQLYGQWIRYEFDIPTGAEGMYQIIPRFKQSIYQGVYSSRKIRINGEIPFQESKKLRFNYKDNWQTKPLNDGETEFEYYLPAGHNVIEFEVSLGDMTALLSEVEQSVIHLNEMYRTIRMITGTNPDNNRDYGFERQIPAVLEGMEEEYYRLTSISAALEEIIGAKGQHTVILDNTAQQLERMYKDTDKIAPNLGRFYSNIGGISSWLLERRNQPLEIDYILIQPADQKLPRVNATFFQNVAFEFRSFLMSFFGDYTTVGLMEEISSKDKVVTVWLGGVTAGRDQAQIVRQMIFDTFTSETGIPVNVKLIAEGSLLPATLAGVGPDVALGRSSGDTINYAIRKAVLPLDDYVGDPSKGIDGFEQVKSRFNPAALVPLTLNNDGAEDPKDRKRVYGLPEMQTFSMLFYRKDVFVELGLDVPTTWDELFDIVPELQLKNLEVGIGPGMGPLTIFMYQQNVPMYVGDGIEINLGSNAALDAFKRMTNLYTVYKFPTIFDFANRFRTGEMPIGVASYDLYNQLTVFAPEIRGLWEFVPMLGTVREKMPEDEGIPYLELGDNMILDNSTPAGVTSTIMLRTAKTNDIEAEAWAFMQWWVGEVAQSRFGNEMVAIMGPAAKQPTANIEALAKMPWPTADYRNLAEQFKYLSAVPEVPGGYIVTRYVDFAWKAVYNGTGNAVEIMQDYLEEMNKELTRKRGEFGMSVIEKDKFGRRVDPDSNEE